MPSGAPTISGTSHALLDGVQPIHTAPTRWRARRAAGSRPPPSNPGPSTRMLVVARIAEHHDAERCSSDRRRVRGRLGESSAHLGVAHGHDAPRLLVARRGGRHRGAKQRLDLLSVTGSSVKWRMLRRVLTAWRRSMGVLSRPVGLGGDFACGFSRATRRLSLRITGLVPNSRSFSKRSAPERSALARLRRVRRPRGIERRGRAGRPRRGAPASWRARTSSTSPGGCAACSDFASAARISARIGSRCRGGSACRQPGEVATDAVGERSVGLLDHELEHVPGVVEIARRGDLGVASHSHACIRRRQSHHLSGFASASSGMRNQPQSRASRRRRLRRSRCAASRRAPW